MSSFASGSVAAAPSSTESSPQLKYGSVLPIAPCASALAYTLLMSCASQSPKKRKPPWFGPGL